MYKNYLFILFVFVSPLSQADDLMARLQRADSYRQSSESVRVEIEVNLFRDKTLLKRRLYSVYIADKRRSMIVSKSSAEKGQKVLMRGEQFHLFLPRSRRAIRITPLQKLLGEASTGDIANMTWHKDYSPRLISESEEIKGVACRLLELKSHRKGTTYNRIELYLQRDSDAPVYAKLYLKSGKLAKEAEFVISQKDGGKSIKRMILKDAIKPGRTTKIKYLSMKAIEIPSKYFNPQYLARHTVK